ncbi:MAG: XTP/dITP diphosphatase [Acidobacteria bacterium]|nr:XTP/dITP diphosphatase [Acidobacteriota bacterium]
MSHIVLATRNAGKLRELRSLLSETGWRVHGLQEIAMPAEVEETGATFSENARRKAVAYSGRTDYPVLADDSGLEVFALGGRPGVVSARYAGEGAGDAERIANLLAELDQTHGGRDARFVCALALALRGHLLLEVEGECRGVIAPEPRGRRGFGYDPVFFFPQLGKTFAELSEEEKNAHSHRGHAVKLLLTRLAEQSGLG